MGILAKRQKFGVAAFLLAASAFLSRIMGLARDKIISWQFGAGGEADMYFAAFIVPDIINYLLAGAFMSITIIPILALCFEKDENNAWRFFSCVLIWMSAASIIGSVACGIWAEPLAALVAPGFNGQQVERLAFFMRIILPAQVFFLSGTCFTALLLLRRQFRVPALTPLIYNGCIILGGVFLPYLPFATDSGQFGMTGYCVGVVLGAFLGAFLLPFYIAYKEGVHLQLVFWHPQMKKFFHIALPLMLGQTIVMLDEQFLRVFGSLLGEGNVSLLNYGRRISQVPVALLGQAIAVASYPFLVRLLAQKELEKFNAALNQALKAGLNLIIPCAGLMIAATIPILGVIFLGGKFGLEEVGSCAPLTQIMLAATPFWILYMVMARAFYATEDTLTPAIVGTIITLLCIPCDYFIAVPLGAWAIALISGLGVAAYSLWLILIWIKRHGRGAFKNIGQDCLASFMLTAVATISSILIFEYLDTLLPIPQNFSTMLMHCVLKSGTFLIVFCLAGILFQRDYLLGMTKIMAKKLLK